MFSATTILCLTLTVAVSLSGAQKVIDNGLATPTFINKPKMNKFEPRCKVVGKPLDLVFILDSSGSLRTKFEEELDVIRDIVKLVAVGEDSVRIGLVQFAGFQRTEFHMNTFTTRKHVLEAISTLRFVAGITKIGEAFKFSVKEFTIENGMRGPEVPKVAFLISDGRTQDYRNNEDINAANALRALGVDIWAYGTGEYVASETLLNYTKDEKKMFTSKSYDRLKTLFGGYNGTEVCEKVPVCVIGSDKPLDLLFVVDSSDSVESSFPEQMSFVHRVLNNINVHPDAVRVAMIQYSTKPKVEFDFRELTTTEDVRKAVFAMTAMNGTTRTDIALNEAYDMFNEDRGMRNASVRKMAIVLTDGHSQVNPASLGSRLVREKNAHVFAIATNEGNSVDTDELLAITDGNSQRVFTKSNLNQFEVVFRSYISFGCPGLNLSQADLEPEIKGPIDITCTANSVSMTIRTQKPFTGRIYPVGLHNTKSCVLEGRGGVEMTLTLSSEQCGIKKTYLESPQAGISYNGTIMLQFHPNVITKIDQALVMECFQPVDSSPQRLGLLELKPPATQCVYNVRKYSADGCVALDAKVGETLFMTWECDNAPNYAYLVHNCFAISETQTLQIVDDEGCEVDPFVMQTPLYNRKKYVYREFNVFKFPGTQNMKFRCSITLCDKDLGKCTGFVPPVCDKKSRRKRAPQGGKGLSFIVESRPINVVENENLRPLKTVEYCQNFFDSFL